MYHVALINYGYVPVVRLPPCANAVSVESWDIGNARWALPVHVALRWALGQVSWEMRVGHCQSMLRCARWALPVHENQRWELRNARWALPVHVVRQRWALRMRVE